MESKSAVRKKILENGGSNVLMPQNEYSDIAPERYILFNKENAIVVEYDDYGLCDYNSSKLYLENDNIKICTGYSLNKDSKIWTRHSWCVGEDGRIYECTPIIRDMYCGYILNEKETEKFISNWKFPEKTKQKSR